MEVKRWQDRVSSLIDDSVQSFLSGTDQVEKNMFDQLLLLCKGLSVDSNGIIRQTTDNMKKTAAIQAIVEKTLLTDSYNEKVNLFLGDYEAVNNLNNSYFSTLSQAFNPNKEVYKVMQASAIEVAKESLVGSGVTEYVIKPVQDLLNKNITSGALWQDMVTQLKEEIIGSEENIGRVSRYASQITWDSLQQYNRTMNEAVAMDLNIEWYRYSDGLVQDSRDYCKERAGEYFHKKEIEDSSHERWAGKSKGTTESTIFIYAGGYNCKHHYSPVPIDVVPDSVIRRNISNGNYILLPKII